MSIAIGTVHGSFYTKCRNALSQKAQHLQVKFSGGPDVRTVQMVNLAGVQVNPVNGSIAAMVESGPVGTLRFVVGTDDLMPFTIQQGEMEIYSTDGTQKLFSMQVQRNGSAWIGNVPTGKNMFAILKNLINGIQGMTCVNGSPPTDTTGKIALALTDLATVLTATRE